MPGQVLQVSLPQISDPDSEDKGAIQNIEYGQASAFVKINYPMVTL